MDLMMGLTNFSFYVTVGRGTESFAESEIRNLFSLQVTETFADVVQVRDGKILFQISGEIDSCVDKILGLKCVERAFVTITDYANSAQGKRDFLNQLMETMLATKNYDVAKKVLEQLSSILYKKLANEAPQVASQSDEPCKKIARLQDTTHSHSQPSHNCDQTVVDLEPGDGKEKKELNKECFTTFRMSVKCSGKSAKWINLKRLSRDVSWRVSKVTNWTVDLRNQDFEICLHISDDYVTVGIPLTKKPLSRRPFILDPGLRAPVAWIMVKLANIESGDIILDPMCGKGTLLLEACSHLQDACYVGTDIDESQIQVAQQNIKSIGHEKYIDLFHANGLCLPFRPMSVNGVMCDAPFNQKHFTSKQADEFYASFLQEMCRVLQKGGRFVLLTSQDFAKMILPLLQRESQVLKEEDTSSALLSNKDDSDLTLDVESDSNKKPCVSHNFSFKLVSQHYMKLGESHGEIIVMTKL